MEFEIKFAVPDAARLDSIASDPCIAARCCGEIREFSMETTYFDAADGMLSARHWTLRTRLENGKSIVTCKTPAGDHARGEWDYECSDPIRAIPLLIAQGAPAALAEITALKPVCGAKFTRRALPLALDGCIAELALDCGTLFRGNAVCPLCEMELELKSGSPDTMLTFAKALARSYGLHEETRSKFARARSL